jgi:hypothetical protein
MRIFGLGSAPAALLILTILPPGTAEKKDDISCSQKTEHHGNAFSIYVRLDVGGPEERTWRYWCRHDVFLGKLLPNADEMSGMYELTDDLVVFTGQSVRQSEGKKTTREIRFGVNYGRIGGRVVFNGFFPTADGNLRCHRRWFVRRGSEWAVAEERTLTLPRDAVKQDAQTWHLPVSGERTRWDEAGKKFTERFAKTLTCIKGEHRWYFWPRDGTGPAWLNGALEPHFAGERVEAITLDGGYVGNLAGISASVADIADAGPAK